MQELFEENKVLKKALIIASSSLKEVDGKFKKLKEENENLQKSVPTYAHMKLNMPLLLDSLSKELMSLRQAAVINKNVRIGLAAEVQELKEAYACKDNELKAIKKRNQLEKKGSYSQINMNKRTVAPITTPRGNKRTSSESFTFG